MKRSFTSLLCLFSVPLALAQTDYIEDGSFEEIPASDGGVRHIQAGYWGLSGNARMETNSFRDDTTAYGDQFINIGRYSRDPVYRGHITQEISGLTTGETYTLSYAVSSNEYHDPGCSPSSHLGSQQLDHIKLTDGIYTNVHSATFTADASAGIFKMLLACPNIFFDFSIDNVSVTGP